jgi:hypothetical protein
MEGFLGGYLILDKVEFFIDGGFGEVEGVFEIIVRVDCVIVFLDVRFLTSDIEFLEVR